MNVLDLLRYDAVVLTTEAVQHASELWGETGRPARKVRGPAASGEEEAA